jgi:hypothetical protein
MAGEHPSKFNEATNFVVRGSGCKREKEREREWEREGEREIVFLVSFRDGPKAMF